MERRWRVTHRRTTLGHSFSVLEPVVPRIIDEFVDCVVYLYPSVAVAQRGATPSEPGQGGTGLLVSVPIEDAPEQHVGYVVTNSHVVGPEGSSPVVRLNTVAGGTDILPLQADDWIHHGDGDDVAVTMVDPMSRAAYKQALLPWERLAITKEQIDEWRVGPGDDVFFLGRFRFQEGRRRNLPTARFGNIARMPLDEGVIHPRGIEQESFIVEARSLSGFSGSPVFLFIAPFAFRGDQTLPGTATGHVALLGIDWGHGPDFSRVLGPDKDTPWRDQELWVKQNSGMMNVVPTWRIGQLLLEDDRLKSGRRGVLDARRARTLDAAALDVAGPTPP